MAMPGEPHWPTNASFKFTDAVNAQEMSRPFKPKAWSPGEETGVRCACGDMPRVVWGVHEKRFARALCECGAWTHYPLNSSLSGWHMTPKSVAAGLEAERRTAMVAKSRAVTAAACAPPKTPPPPECCGAPMTVALGPNVRVPGSCGIDWLTFDGGARCSSCQQWRYLSPSYGQWAELGDLSRDFEAEYQRRHAQQLPTQATAPTADVFRAHGPQETRAPTADEFRDWRHFVTVTLDEAVMGASHPALIQPPPAPTYRAARVRFPEGVTAGDAAKAVREFLEGMGVPTASAGDAGFGGATARAVLLSSSRCNCECRALVEVWTALDLPWLPVKPEIALPPAPMDFPAFRRLVPQPRPRHPAAGNPAGWGGLGRWLP